MRLVAGVDIAVVAHALRRVVLQSIGVSAILSASLVCYIPLAQGPARQPKLALYGRTDYAAMLRREPTRIEMKSEDLEEFDRFQAQQKKAAKEEAGAPESKQDDARKAAREGRIGLRSDSY